MNSHSKLLGSPGDGLTLRWQFIIFAIAVLAIASRDISLFTHAQFYAEDGKVWYAQSYNIGWLRPLSLPEGGYLNTVQRLIADLALLVRFRWAPLAMALGGLLLQALPVPILLSERCRNWAPLPMRLAFAAVYIGIPDAREVHIVCTNSQWHLALIMIFLAFAPAPKHLWDAIADLLLLIVGAVSGPFAMLLVPFVIAFWFARRNRWSVVVLCILSAGSLIQLITLWHHHVQRNAMYLGASFPLFVRLTGGNAFIGAMLGTHRFGSRLPFVCSLAALLLGLILIGYVFRYAAIEVKLFLVFCFAVFAAGLRSPYFIYSPRPLWAQLLETPSQRYSYFPSLALLFAILWCVFYGRNALRTAGAILALITCVGIYTDWRIPPIPYREFPNEVAVFDAAPPGTKVVLPVFPVYPDWYMELWKKPAR